MRKWGVVLFSWYFLAAGSLGTYSWNRQFTQVGPFDTKEDCDKGAEWVNRVDNNIMDVKSMASWCWWDGKGGSGEKK